MQISLNDSTPIVADAVANAERARAAGLYRYWTPQIMNADTMATLAVVASQVPDIKFGTSVMAMQTMLPQTMAQQARTVNQVSGGRLTLGLGVNHEPVVTARWGLPWDKPYSRLVEYLDALIPLLEGKPVSVDGDYVSHHTQIAVPSETPAIMLAALGPRMLRLAGERASGTVLWMTGPRTITEHIRPNLGDGHVMAGVGVICTDDIPAARAAANAGLAIYPTLPSYKAVMDREGAAEAADLVLIGGATEIREGLALYEAAGADEVGITMMGNPEQNEAAWQVLEGLGRVDKVAAMKQKAADLANEANTSNS